MPPLFALAAVVSRIIPERLRRVSHHVPGLNPLLIALLDHAAPAAPVDLRVAGGPLANAWLRLDLKSEREYWFGFYERRLLKAIGDFCQPGMAVYDLGANIGYTALLCARKTSPGGMVYAFEPLAENLQRMQLHLDYNNAARQIMLVAAAASDCAGSETFLVHHSGAMGKLVGSGDRATSYVSQQQVPVVRLDDFVYREGHREPDLVKIDIEGGGVKAFPGMVDTLSRARPLLLLELHGPEEKQAALDVLTPHGYQLHHMLPDYPALKDERELHIQWRQHLVAIPPHRGST